MNKYIILCFLFLSCLKLAAQPDCSSLAPKNESIKIVHCLVSSERSANFKSLIIESSDSEESINGDASSNYDNTSKTLTVSRNDFLYLCNLFSEKNVSTSSENVSINKNSKSKAYEPIIVFINLGGQTRTININSSLNSLNYFLAISLDINDKKSNLSNNARLVITEYMLHISLFLNYMRPEKNK